MRLSLFTFQINAITDLHRKIIQAHNNWSETDPQAISFSAPTGSGKTVIMTTLIEELLFGGESVPANPDSIFLWLSDSPELNEQSKHKMETHSDKIRVRDLITIDNSFDAQSFQPGTIYFLNTQKLGEDKLLIQHRDDRTYTIWETITNTAHNYPKNFYVIIDEAHRGALSSAKDQEAQSIMQKFVKGCDEDGLIVMPLIIGVSATPKRFEDLLSSTTTSTLKVKILANDVRESGLLKDRVIIHYPATQIDADMSMFKSAVENWIEKSKQWEAYCLNNSEPIVRPALIIQVNNVSGSDPSSTDLNECISILEYALGRKPRSEELAHTFTDQGDIVLGDLIIRRIEPSKIQEDTSVRVVFFKMNLSTGWDCPRAETMMSFRSAQDFTYVAQLLGRMVRTPLARRIQANEELNNVSLFLPYFNEETVKSVVKSLQESELSFASEAGSNREFISVMKNPDYDSVFAFLRDFPTYQIDSSKARPYIQSYVRLARTLSLDGIEKGAQKKARTFIVNALSSEIVKLKDDGEYESLAKQLTGITVGSVILNYGESTFVYDEEKRSLIITQYDVDRLFETAGRVLGEGLHTDYWKANQDRKELDVKTEIIVITNSPNSMKSLEAQAKERFNKLYTKNQHAIESLPEVKREKYHKIIRAIKDPVSVSWNLPDVIEYSIGNNCEAFSQHLYCDKTKDVKLSLNPWETRLVKEELLRGVVTWLRNIERKPWAFTIPYTIDGRAYPFYPDFLFVRSLGNEYIVDILEPHDASRKDNVGKAKGMAMFATKHGGKFGRIQLIRLHTGIDGKEHIYRLELNDLELRNRVLGITTNSDLDRLFDEYERVES